MEHIIIDVTKPNTYQFPDTVFAIGRFQALHFGHQHLLQQAQEMFPEKKLGVLTFSPDPRDFFSNTIQKKILTRTERLEKFSEFGVHTVIEFVFNQTFANMSKVDFVTFLKTLGIKRIVHGKDFRFGRFDDSSQADHPMMQAVEDIYIDTNKVSSSLLSTYLQEGQIEQLNNALNYTYNLSGIVVNGEKRARKLGFPTANLLLDDEKMEPGDGVYATKTIIDYDVFESITHIGSSPTFHREMKTIETHILGIDRDLYGKKLTVQFFKQIRGVQTFSGIDEVKNQLKQDVKCVKSYFK